MLSIATVLAARTGVGLAPVMAWRYLLAAPLLFLIAGFAAVRAVPPRRALALLVLGGAGQSAVTWLSLSALAWLPAAAVGFLFYTYPAWVAILVAVAGIERLTGVRVAALSVALAGITVMIGPPWAMELPLPGVLRALGGAVVYAAFIPMVHWLRGPLDAATASTFIIAGCAIGFTVMAVRGEGLVATMTPVGWGAAVVLAVVCTVVAFLAFMKGLGVLGPVRTAILSTTEPFWTAVLGVLILAQPIGASTWIGGACIVVAILLLQRPVPSQ